MADPSSIEAFVDNPIVKYPAVAAAAIAAVTTAYSRGSAFVQLFAERRVRRFLRLLDFVKDRKDETTFLAHVITEEVFRSAYGRALSGIQREVVMKYVSAGVSSFETLVLAQSHYRIRQGKICMAILSSDRWIHKLTVLTSLVMVLFGAGLSAIMGVTTQLSVPLLIACLMFIIMGVFFLYQTRDMEAALRLEREIGIGNRGAKEAEPGATDNPDDAQRLREDH